ncbi:MAG TPA: hypothetical protein VIV15_05575 [Anaerolineales bacterium]
MKSLSQLLEQGWMLFLLGSLLAGWYFIALEVTRGLRWIVEVVR